MRRTATLFDLQTFLGPSEQFHLSKNLLSKDTPLEYHYHDYFEVFWVANGTGTHLLNGKQYTLKEGTLVFMRPHDCHTFDFESPKEQLILYNLAFYPRDVALFKKRYFNGEEVFFWSMAENLPPLWLTPDQLRSLSHRADVVLEASRSLFYLDQLLMNVFKLLHFSKVSDQGVPHWLAYALQQFKSGYPEGLYKGGVEAFLHLCKRSRAHVNRSLRKYYGQNVTQCVNHLRLLEAKERLATTNKGIKRIAYELGYKDVNYFHKLFKAEFGFSPNEFRKKNTIAF
ncbi:helix-turn-helix domain-containing protein [Flavobacteriaceae bacterium TP-CH-4]|uniref:Helix-turn-helix domain-containing protein n=1 Tax=Pelagihabitans pacificus TaxID=2696054 RepID=A0A967E5L6_9FLAO|nr:helix-turn-helix domain-containing protein [Pelagihabitans pacificus]NHF59552.1 helix-turn-helix domain-containing protein [Pelagihabitans pacificus]